MSKTNLLQPRTFLVLLLLGSFQWSIAGDYEDAWAAFNQNDRQKASTLFKKAMKDPTHAIDAYLSYLYVMYMDEKDGEITDFTKMVYEKAENPYPYIYALWHKGAVTGSYGKKSEKSHQIQLLDKIDRDTKVNGSLKASSNYVRGTHLLFSNSFESAAQYKAKMQAIENWQYVGPFDNSSESGFDKNYQPIAHPEPSATFISSRNAEITWFTPKYSAKDGWENLFAHIVSSTAVSYAQTFVNSPTDMEAYICVGGNGSMKVWVNDQLVIVESEERQTELDAYKNKCKLNKGYNRILVQMGYTKIEHCNFIVRLTDANQHPLPNLKAVAQYQPYTPNTEKVSATSITHFAEAFFQEKLSKEPNNLVNYLLAADTYLRNEKHKEAREVLEKASKLAPNNSIILYLLTQCFNLSGNRTVLSKTLERIKENEKGKSLGYFFEMRELIEARNFSKALAALEAKANLSQKDETYYTTKIELLAADKQIDAMIKTINEGFEKFPSDESLLGNLFSLKKNGYKDNKGAIALLENYLKKNFSFSITQRLAREYIDAGSKAKGIATLERLYQTFPHDADLAIGIGRKYFEEQDYNNALKYCGFALDISPYTAIYHHNLAMIYMQKGEMKEAEKYLTQSLKYDANRYDSQKKLREIRKKEPVENLFPKTDIYELIANSMKSTPKGDFDAYLIAEEVNKVVYPEGGQETYFTIAVKVLNQKAIERFHEYELGYNRNSQDLVIEKAEVIKKSGGKVQAEAEDNVLVFTNLEPEDVIYMKYRIQTYYYGKIAKEFMDDYNFDGYIPVTYSRYALLVANNHQFQYNMLHSDLKPTEKEIDGFKLYVWEKRDIPELKPEPLMPELCDIAPTLHISSFKSWNDISNWYSDLAYAKTQEDYELREVYKELFEGKTGLSDLEKAHLIYNYLLKNIRYSSVPFRQGSYVPQKASKTLVTQLGDCKDLSSLFVALAKMAGLKTRLVLINTRDNGRDEMTLPSVSFNHCIVQLIAGGKDYFLELTDNTLPFGALPPSLYEASYLEIPQPDEPKTPRQLQHLKPQTRMPNATRSSMNINLNKGDFEVKARYVKTGVLTSGVRYNLSEQSADKQKEYMQKRLGEDLKKSVEVKEVKFETDLTQLTDSVAYQVGYTSKNEVIEVGEMSMFRLPILDVFVTLERFPQEKRNFPIEYWEYEHIDTYENEYLITLPGGKAFTEIPADVAFEFHGISYSLQYVKLSSKELKVIRKAHTNRDNISAEDYADFKAFVEKIVKAEAKYVAFK